MTTLKMLVIEMLIIANILWYWVINQQVSAQKLQTTSTSPIRFTIGALLSSISSNATFFDAIAEANSRYKTFNPSGRLIFEPRAELMEANALRAAEQVCNLIKDTEGTMFALIVSHPPDRPTVAPLSPSFTCAFYDLPIIGITARQSAFSDKYSHTSFLRTMPPYSQEASAWSDLIRLFQWREVTFIHSDDQEGKTLLSRLERFSEDGKYFRITRHVSFDAEDDEDIPHNFTDVLLPVRNEQTRALVLYAKQSHADRIFEAAKQLGMLNEEWAWIVTEQALNTPHPPQGMIGVRLAQAGEEAHVRDAVKVATEGILRLYNEETHIMQFMRSPLNCDMSPTQVVSKEPRSGGEGKSGRIGKGKVDTSVEYKWSTYGQKLYKLMISVALENGTTGRVAFDEKGDRRMPVYDIVNIHYVNDTTATTAVSVGTYGRKREKPPTWDPKEPFLELLNVDMWQLRWPGNHTIVKKQEVCYRYDEVKGDCIKKMETVPAAPTSFKKKTMLKVVTKESVPFVYARELKPGEMCDTSTDPTVLKKEVPCTHTDPKTGFVRYLCCRGYCIDLLRRLANRTGIEDINNFTPFTYELHLVGDGEVGQEVSVSAAGNSLSGAGGKKVGGDGSEGSDDGSFVSGDSLDSSSSSSSGASDSSGGKLWTGIVGELLNGQADLAVAPMTITPERAARVEFTKPFKYLGLNILVRRVQAKSNLASFLQPFENTLWVLVGLSVHVVALVLYLLDRFSPFGRFKLAKSSDTEEDALNLSSAMWFAWGVLLNSGIGEGTPRSFSARVLGMVWAGFAMIIVASYTANLAAFLVLDRPDSIISGIDDPRLRNPQDDFTFATVKNSPVEMYFKRQVEYATMYRTMETKNYPNAEDAIEAVKKERLHAFIWDSARLNFEASNDCNLITAGETFGRTGYGLAMKKENPWLYEMSQAVLNFHERGFMETLDTQWILTKAEGCERTQSSPATLGLTNMAGVFIMVAFGIVAGVFLIFIEIAYKKRRGMKEKELELAKNAADRWRGTIEKRKILRKTRSLERGISTGGIGCNNEEDISPSTTATTGLTSRAGVSSRGMLRPPATRNVSALQSDVAVNVGRVQYIGGAPPHTTQPSNCSGLDRGSSSNTVTQQLLHTNLNEMQPSQSLKSKAIPESSQYHGRGTEHIQMNRSIPQYHLEETV